MTVIKSGFKADSRNLKETFTGSWARVVTRNSNGLTINRYPIVEISGSVTYVAFSNSAAATCFNIMHSPLLPQLGNTYIDENGASHLGVMRKSSAAANSRRGAVSACRRRSLSSR